jgi:hypothetical protein
VLCNEWCITLTQESKPTSPIIIDFRATRPQIRPHFDKTAVSLATPARATS